MPVLRPTSNVVNNSDNKHNLERPYLASILSHKLSCIKSNNDFCYRLVLFIINTNSFHGHRYIKLEMNIGWTLSYTQEHKCIAMDNGLYLGGYCSWTT